MKWFKHDSNANMDAKLKKLRIKYQMEGYGLYWYCLELIAGSVEKHNLTFELEHDAEILASDTNIHIDRIHEMMQFMADLGLFENDRGIVTCLKMATRTDEYTQKLIKTTGTIKTLSRQTPDTISTKSVLIEENRREEKRKIFTPPTNQDVDLYAKEKNFNLSGFFDYYASNGWMVGRGKMKCWHSAASGWNRRQSRFSNGNESQTYGAHGI